MLQGCQLKAVGDGHTSCPSKAGVFTVPLVPPEFTREVTDTQMPLVAPVILPEMYKIFTMAEVRVAALGCSRASRVRRPPGTCLLLLPPQ